MGLSDIGCVFLEVSFLKMNDWDIRFFLEQEQQIFLAFFQKMNLKTSHGFTLKTQKERERRMQIYN